MKILFFGDGKSVHTQRWLTAMVERGVDTFLVTDRPEPIDGVHIIELHCSRNSLIRSLMGRKMRSIASQVKPDIVHGHYITSYGLWAAQTGVKPLVLTAWGTDILVTPKNNKLFYWLTQSLLKKASLITADALLVEKVIHEIAPAANVVQVQWGIDLDRYPLREQQTTSDTFNIISLRLWEPNYRIDVIIDAFALLRKAVPERQFHLHLLGGGSLETQLKKQVGSQLLDDCVTFHGRLPEAEVMKLLYQADLSVMVPESDATAISLLESMACGVPLVVSDIAANREWIDGKNGILVSEGDDTLAQAMIRIARNDSDRLTMASKGRELIEKKANRQVEMDRMYGIYQGLLEK